jgi:nucleotide-binding universal stress UspA family protein
VPRPNAELLVAYDDTDAARRALEFAIERAARTGESVDVVHVGSDVSEPEIRRTLEDLAVDRGVVATVEVVPTGGSDAENVSVPARLAALIEDRDYELLVMGNERHGLFYDLLEGSVSEALIERQAIPLLLVP